MTETNALGSARKVALRLRQEGYRSYLVGGCVRDMLLGREPKDFDVVSDATPAEVQHLFPHAIPVGAHFGVVLVRDYGSDVEVATFRSDLAYSDGRHPAGVRFEKTPEEDAKRRDFTINALFLDPETGQILDFHGGQDDLQGRWIRAIGDPVRRFEEDRLRMLRAVRFAARLDFRIQYQTMLAIQQRAESILQIAAERVRDEILMILTEGHARRGFELLDESGLLQVLLPEIARMKGVEQPPQYHPEGDVWTHTLMMLDNLPREASHTLALGVLLHDVGKPPTFRIAERIRFDGHVEEGVAISAKLLDRFRLPGDESRQVESLVANHMKFKDVKVMRESTLKRFLRLPDFDEHLELHRLDCLCSNGQLDHYRFVQERRQELGEERIAPARLLTGADLIAEGFLPGPAFGRILTAVEDAQLEGQIETREQAVQYAKLFAQSLREQA